jgi:hypothetical protein
MRLILLSLLSFFLLAAEDAGCRRRGGPSGDDRLVPAKTPRPVEFLRQQLAGGYAADARSLTAQAVVTAENDGQTIQFTTNIIWLRDSVIWINARKFGLEAVRALITPDSIVALNRLENTYSVKTWPELRREYSLPAGFELLQPLLLSAAYVLPELDYTAGVRDSLHVLTGAGATMSAEYALEEGTFRLRREQFIDRREGRSVTISFDRYKKLDGAAWFSYLRRIEAFSPTDGAARLEIEFNTVTVNESKPYRFEIPAHYRRVD